MRPSSPRAASALQSQTETGDYEKIGAVKGLANPLKSTDSDEGIQGNPRKSKTQIRGKGRSIEWNPKQSKEVGGTVAAFDGSWRVKPPNRVHASSSLSQ
jgi:hypothetical protein